MSELVAAPGGWVRYADTSTGNRFYLRYDMGADRPVAVDAFVVSTQRVSGRTWRTVPFDDIDLWVARPAVTAVLGLPAADGLSLVIEIELRIFGDSQCKTIEAVTLGDAKTLLELAKLERPVDGLTDAFMAQLADAYYALVSAKRNPAGPIAEQTGAPVRTVHRWISEARKRGHLGPARRGRVG